MALTGLSIWTIYQHSETWQRSQIHTVDSSITDCSPSLRRWWHYDKFCPWVPACYWQIRQIPIWFWMSWNPAHSSRGKEVDSFRQPLLVYRIMGYFRVDKIFAVLSKKTWGLFFADFNFRGSRRPRKIISILFREIRRVGCSARLSLYKTNVRKENLRPNE